jgi:hypothetical protein
MEARRQGVPRGMELLPVVLYEIGGSYFVLDGKPPGKSGTLPWRRDDRCRGKGVQCPVFDQETRGIRRVAVNERGGYTIPLLHLGVIACRCRGIISDEPRNVRRDRATERFGSPTLWRRGPGVCPFEASPFVVLVLDPIKEEICATCS